MHGDVRFGDVTHGYIGKGSGTGDLEPRCDSTPPIGGDVQDVHRLPGQQFVAAKDRKLGLAGTNRHARLLAHFAQTPGDVAPVDGLFQPTGVAVPDQHGEPDSFGGDPGKVRIDNDGEVVSGSVAGDTHPFGVFLNVEPSDLELDAGEADILVERDLVANTLLVKAGFVIPPNADDRHTVGTATDQLVDGQPTGLALEVPEGDVNG